MARLPCCPIAQRLRPLARWCPRPGESLLFAARFFDEALTGYLKAEDLEEIFFMTARPGTVSREYSGPGTGWEAVLGAADVEPKCLWA
jgi:hypothetical protein